jgi:hypothetical protein
LKTSTIQEKWVDNRSEYQEFDHKKWEKEGDELIREANEKSKKQARVTTAVDNNVDSQ